MKRALVTSAFTLALGLGVAAAAPPAPAGQQQVRYQKTTQYDFDNDEVTAGIARPDGVLVEGHRKGTHESLIKPRLNFVPEMIKSTEEGNL